ncbi:PREDICTED: T-lymphocyte activation antigen CD86 isoform X2 [Condylura cristata]|uniref:T-lymphocyte activation antigen CD86 isoform X2 n=1 Tax=Condylura cristata TaxID=143302 RepID=UPI000642A96E|nr:PREDICTED: T-lymphocyte activation antigen CD86 isoform X2 [Condylura cristata]
MDLGCIMGLKNALFVMVFLISDAAAETSQAYFGDTGLLPCRFKNPQNTSLDELVVFWQNQDKVLYELYTGSENPHNVHPMYKGRTSFDLGSWTLKLHNIEIKDEGTYYCYVHHKQRNIGMVPIYQMGFYLSVLANFSQPEIMEISNGTENSGIINVTCSSQQGYPEPIKMFFVIKTENSSDEYMANMMIYQDNVTELYSVSASLSFPVPPEAKMVNISCALEPQVTMATLYSPSLIIVAIQVEEEERGQPKDSVEYHVPASCDEAHCVVNTQKTATDDKSAAHF